MKWYRRSQAQLQLPPIPQDSVRLTHFTSQRVAQALLSGQNFNIGTKLSSTTDAFSDNNSIIQLIQTGRTGAWTRGGFGTVIVLIDLSNRENWTFNSPRTSFVINSKILGVVDSKTMKFTPNPRYDPSIPQPFEPVPNQSTKMVNKPGQDEIPTNVPVNAPANQEPW